MLAQYSIRTKIIAVVAFLLVAMTGMGLLAVKNMRSINANTVDITTSWLPSVRVLGDLRAGVITYRNVIREHMLAETLDEKLAMEKTLATVIEANTKFRAAYEPIAKAIFVVDTPGVSTANLKALPFRRVPRPIYPLDPNTPKPVDL